MSLVKHHSSRLKIVEEEYSKLKQKVWASATVVHYSNAYRLLPTHPSLSLSFCIQPSMYGAEMSQHINCCGYVTLYELFLLLVLLCNHASCVISFPVGSPPLPCAVAGSDAQVFFIIRSRPISLPLSRALACPAAYLHTCSTLERLTNTPTNSRPCRISDVRCNSRQDAYCYRCLGLDLVILFWHFYGGVVWHSRRQAALDACPRFARAYVARTRFHPRPACCTV